MDKKLVLVKTDPCGPSHLRHVARTILLARCDSYKYRPHLCVREWGVCCMCSQPKFLLSIGGCVVSTKCWGGVESGG